jgi:hypothetical protein
VRRNMHRRGGKSWYADTKRCSTMGNVGLWTVMVGAVDHEGCSCYR